MRIRIQLTSESSAGTPTCSPRLQLKRKRDDISEDEFLPEKRNPSKRRTQRKLTLKRSMEKTLKNGGWLSDEHIELTQEILKDQFPHVEGLDQLPLLSENDGFVAVQGEGIQIQHINGDHWVTSASIGREVAVYDSRFKGGDLSSSLTHQLASLYRPLVILEEDGVGVDPHLVVYVPPVQQQSGTSDCGAFAIAFAVHLLLGDKLEAAEFDQSKMRQHLLICLKERKFSAFPKKQKYGYRARHFPYREIELYCIDTCLMPETYRETMIECDKCERWFHTDCVGVASVPEHWYCNSCKGNNS